jgi:cation:H+ antiporter
MAYLNLGLGLVLLVIGGEGLVRGSVTLARRLGVSTLLVGLTIAAWGTSAPELVVSIQAARIEAPGLVLGNVVGSNIANILLILAIAGLLRPIEATPAALRRDGAAVAAATVVLAAMLATGGAFLWHGVALLVMLAGLFAWTFHTERIAHDEAARFHEQEALAIEPPPFTPALAPLYVAVGLILLAYGADLFVRGAIELALRFGVSDTLIGLTIVAVGTSLPELFTCAIAALRGQSALALGNVMGSNVFNALGIVGVTALVAPLPLPADLGLVDIGALLGSMALLLVFVTTGLKLVRWESALMLALYGAYLGYKTALA